MHQGGAAADGVGDMHRFGHLAEVRALLEARLGVGVDTVGTLHGMGDTESDQRLLPCSQFPFSENGTVVVKKLLRQLRRFLADFGKLAKVFRFVITVHLRCLL